MASFNINYPGNSNDFVIKAKNAINTKGGVFIGDSTKGAFTLKTAIGAVQGNYQVLPVTSSGQTDVAITITKKPFIVSMKKIQEVISDYF
ncbi:MAG: hypothetical protein V4683_04455, partial [Bacteroidota bacterium]